MNQGFLAVPGLQLHADFITQDEERELLAAIDASEWDTSLKRRTQHYGYVYDYTMKGLDETEEVLPIPEWCGFVIQRLLERGVLVAPPDQLIINEYEPGQGIYPHVDSVSSFEDGIVSVSLGSDIVMDFLHPPTNAKKDGTLLRRSALSMHGIARYQWRHGIAARKSDHGVPRARRVSLTFRKIKVLF